MQVSRTNKIHRAFKRTPVAAGILLALASPALLAQESTIEEIIVTSQKREESMQKVPISIQTLNNQSLSELGLMNFQDYTKMLPTVSTTPGLGAGSGFANVYMRGIATAGDGQATTSQPSVGMYLDELPVTTIQGNLDIHLYDVARIEALAGPQGTLYGASSQAGTIRVITNKPVLEEFSSSVGVEGNIVDGDDTGYVVEGYVNVPVNDRMAIRLVGWSRQDAGYIDNVSTTRVMPGNEDMVQFQTDDPGTPADESLLQNPTWCGSTTDCSADDITIDNAALAKENYNTLDTIGARAALRIDLNDNWTVTPTVMAQKQEGEGSWGDDLSSFVPGDNAVAHFTPEFTNDEWTMVGLTIEGRVSNFDVVYSGSYLDRTVDGSFDYTDYAYWYDTIYTTGYYADLHFANTGPRAVPNQFFPTAGSRLAPVPRVNTDDDYTKENHEIRISTDPDKRVRGMLGFFWQHQYHDFEQHWDVPGLGDIMLMNGGTDPRFQDTVYLNSFDRNDYDRAVFGQVSFDITDDLELTVGARFFEPQVTVRGFFGFGLGFTPIWSSNGENRCNLTQGDSGWTPLFNGQADYKDTPCLNVDKGIAESEHIGRVNLTWNLSDDVMFYATWSEGYRPGGINRNPSAGEYQSDFLTNWEAGWKTQLLDNTVQFNGAVFYDTWDDFQVSFTGANAITQVDNGPSASVLGTEMQMVWLPTDNLRITASAAYLDTQLEDDYVNLDAMGNVTRVLAPKGTRLPVTAKLKGNLIGRYMFPLAGFDAHLQGAVVHEGKRDSDMDQRDNAIRGGVPAYTTADLSAGIAKEDWSVELFIKNATDEDAPIYLTAQCVPTTCGGQNYGVRFRPRTFAIRYTKDF